MVLIFLLLSERVNLLNLNICCVGVDAGRPRVGRRMGSHLELPASEAVRARGGEATVQQIARGSAEVARHGLQRHTVSANILEFQGTSGQFYQNKF
jgi:hypothetical protein